jgi:ABC-type nickel/cobalt efflux system permease component RcnA
MTQHHQKHSHTHSGESRIASAEKKWHKNWRVWLAVGIMLLAISMYVLTLDESIVPAIMGR